MGEISLQASSYLEEIISTLLEAILVVLQKRRNSRDISCSGKPEAQRSKEEETQRCAHYADSFKHAPPLPSTPSRSWLPLPLQPLPSCLWRSLFLKVMLSGDSGPPPFSRSWPLWGHGAILPQETLPSCFQEKLRTGGRGVGLLKRPSGLLHWSTGCKESPF